MHDNVCVLQNYSNNYPEVGFFSCIIDYNLLTEFKLR